MKTKIKIPKIHFEYNLLVAFYCMYFKHVNVYLFIYWHLLSSLIIHLMDTNDKVFTRVLKRNTSQPNLFIHYMFSLLPFTLIVGCHLPSPFHKIPETFPCSHRIDELMRVLFRFDYRTNTEIGKAKWYWSNISLGMVLFSKQSKKWAEIELKIIGKRFLW